MYGEGVCADIRESQFNGGIQYCSAEKTPKSHLVTQYKEICKENNSIAIDIMRGDLTYWFSEY